jgi:8-oxo-dGTP pyrophosphatase MutT (NUDIX family)
VDDLRRRLVDGVEHDLSARERLLPRDATGPLARPISPPAGILPRLGAVLALLYPQGGDLYVPLTVRTAHMRHHSGEISLPGGGFDPSDGTLEQTALREAEEEIGIVPASIEVITSLTPVWIPVSNFQITPFVGLIYQRPDFMVAAAEVAAIVEAPLSLLLDDATVRSEVRELRGSLTHVPFFAVDEYKVWGATAIILAQLVGRLRQGQSTL